MRRFLKIFWVVSIVLAFFLLVLPYVSPRFRGLLNNLVHPILPGVSKSLYSESDIVKENSVLKERVAYYQSQKDFWDSLFDENRKLREFQKMQPIPLYSTIVASVSVRSPLTGKYRFIIDKGEIHGLKPGMPVLVGDSILGRIVEVRGDHAVVGTLAMQSVNVFCRIKGTDYYGKLSGEAQMSEEGKLFCSLTWLPRDVELKPGMIVLTSGFASEEEMLRSGAGLIPRNIKIGTIRDVSKNEKFQEAVVELSANWRSFEHITVLKKNLEE
ncbi:MAG: rod shape-determining protein MreC [Lentisphaeraceae bacterium]|nr:rod shape-determining protein MreC [Lentisphaeraceae bacterium]